MKRVRRRVREDACRHCSGTGRNEDRTLVACRPCRGTGLQPRDASLLPREYLTPDLAKIRLMVKALKNKEHAERQIPGITVTSRAAVSVRV